MLTSILTPCVLAAPASTAQAEELVLPNVAVNAEKLADINPSAVLGMGRSVNVGLTLKY
ncbi:MAG: hypothetical protein LAC66_03460 [Methylotenera sp.]|nr:hypothetical protein [Methylotenera sp.]